MVFGILTEYIVCNILDKHKNKLPTKIQALITADDSLKSLLNKDILPRAMKLFMNENASISQDEAFVQQTLAPAIAYVIHQSVFSGQLPNEQAAKNALEKLISDSTTPSQKIQIKNLLNNFTRHFNTVLAEHQSPGDVLIIAQLTRIRDEILSEIRDLPSHVTIPTNEKIDKQRYAQIILKRFEEWHKRHTPLFAEYRRFELFAVDLTDTVEEQIPIADLPKLSSIIVLLGESGAGKTEALQDLFVDYCKQLIDGEIGQIPILINLRNWSRQNKLHNLIENEFVATETSSSTIKDMLTKGECVILFDGLNELPFNPDERREAQSDIRNILKKYSNNHFLFTCRTPDYVPEFIEVEGEAKVQCFEIQRLTQEQIKEYVHRYFNTEEKLAEDFLSKLNIDDESQWKQKDAFVQLARIPLFLLIMISEYRQTQSIPSNKARVINVLSKRVFQRGEAFQGNRIDEDSQTRILAYLAYQGVTKNHYQTIPERLAKTIVQDIFAVLRQQGRFSENVIFADVWQQVFTQGFLIYSGGGNWETSASISWLHQLIFDYFLATEIIKIILNASSDEEKDIRLDLLHTFEGNLPRFAKARTSSNLIRGLVGTAYNSNLKVWEQPLQIALGLLDPNEAAFLLGVLLEVNPEMSRIAFNGQNQNDADAIGEEIIQLFMRSDNIQRVITVALELASASVVNGFARIFKNSDHNTRRQIVEAISSLVQEDIETSGAKRGVELLEAWIANSDEIVRFYAAKGLWVYDKGRAASVLSSLYQTGSSDVKRMIDDLKDEWDIE